MKLSPTLDLVFTTSGTPSLLSIFGSRLLLNMREAAGESPDGNSKAHASISGIRFAGAPEELSTAISD